MTSGVLRGIRVLDFGRYIAGPYCAALLGDLGAEVIRVERVSGSEDRFLMPLTKDGDGAMFLQCNARQARDDPRPDVRAGARSDAAARANRGRGRRERPLEQLVRMGLDYDALVVEKPDVVLTTITAFGSGGAKADTVGFDGIGQAMSGAMYMSGKSGEPAKAVPNYVDFTTALSAALGTVAALFERSTTGRGQVVDSSLLASGLTLMNSTLIEEAVLATGRVGSGNRSQLSGPSDTFQTKDGYVLVQTVGNPLFERWAHLIGEPQWTSEPEVRGRLEPRRTRQCALRAHAIVVQRTHYGGGHLCARGREDSVGKVHSPRDALNDPDVSASGFFEPAEYPGIDAKIPVARAPFGLSSGGVGIHGRAPKLGEHTDRILTGARIRDSGD